MGNRPEEVEINQEQSLPDNPTRVSCASKFVPEMESIKLYRKERFRREILGSMVKRFLNELPNRLKIDNSLFLISDGEEFREFLIRRGKLFIDCDTDALLEEDDDVIQSLRNCKPVLSNKGKKLYLPLCTSTRIYGALRLESLSGFSEKDVQIYLSECNRFAFELESRIEYESIILDPVTLAYKSNHFQTILHEKFLSDLPIALFLLDISRSDNREALISFLAEFFQFPIFEVGEERLAFFLYEDEMENLAVRIQDAILELDRQNFYAEFVLAFSLKTESMRSPADWWEDASQQIQYAKKKIPPTQTVALRQ